MPHYLGWRGWGSRRGSGVHAGTCSAARQPSFVELGSLGSVLLDPLGAVVGKSHTLGSFDRHNIYSLRNEVKQGGGEKRTRAWGFSWGGP